MPGLLGLVAASLVPPDRKGRAIASVNGEVLVSCEPMWQSTPTTSMWPMSRIGFRMPASLSAAASCSLTTAKPVSVNVTP